MKFANKGEGWGANEETNLPNKTSLIFAFHKKKNYTLYHFT